MGREILELVVRVAFEIHDCFVGEERVGGRGERRE